MGSYLEKKIKYIVYYGGHWLKNYAGELSYTGGKDKSIDCYADEFFRMLSPEEINGQNMWYKLPFEDHKYRKRLCNGDISFDNMCQAVQWCGLAEVFMVNAAEYPEDETCYKPCEEEVRVERHANGFLDEDPDFDYHNTPPNSDGEEEEGEKMVRCKKGSGELKMNQVFDTLEEFQEALVDYALKGAWNIKKNRWGKETSGAICGVNDGCQWRIYCSYEEHLGKWKVKTFHDVHSCMKDYRCKILKKAVIAKMFLNDIWMDPDYKPKTIQHQIEQRFELITTIDKCKKAKAKAIDMINKDHLEQFSRLRDYRLALLEKNQDSTVILDTVTDDDGNDVFRRFYVCFNVLKQKWSMWCRPIFGLDGCFMKSTLKGQLLAAVGRDSNNGMYPFAWAVVDIENEDNWKWFIRKLKDDFNLLEGQGYTIISDRQKGLLNAVESELPQVEHRMCARHIYGNLKKKFPNQSEMKGLFWRVAESYTASEYKKAMEQVQRYDMRLYEAIMEKNPQNCSLAYFGTASSCIDVHNNISESFNNAIDPARYVPMVEMLETIRRRTMIRIEQRYNNAINNEGRFTLFATKWVDLEQQKVKFCKMFPGSNDQHEVQESGMSYSVNMRLRTCACRRWDMSGLPCRHALRVIADKTLNYEDYISNWFSNTRQQQIYNDSIRPVNGMLFWNQSGAVVLPPPCLVENVENKVGRKPKPKRKKSRHESPTKKKASREKRIMHCSRCGEAGHNATKCQNMVVENFKKKAAKAKKKASQRNGGYESMTLEDREGPSQPTQKQN